MQRILASSLLLGTVLGLLSASEPAVADEGDPSAADREIREQIDRLASPEYLVREEATKALIKMGKAALPEIQKVAASSDLEVSLRSRQIVAEIRLADQEASQPDGVEHPDGAVLLYDPATGDVKIDATNTESRVIISFILGTDQKNLRTANTAFPFIDVGTNTDNTTFQISQTDPLNQGQGPVVHLGAILPVGMNKVALARYLTLCEYASALGVGGKLGLSVRRQPEKQK